MACEHSLDWRDCDRAGHEEGCFIASCSKCSYESRDCEECRHEVIRWLHSERVRGCESCDNATEYEQGELTPCELIACVACGADVEPSTDAHHRQLLTGAGG
jgi:hypothetical protein